jgi:hypothetical protein
MRKTSLPRVASGLIKQLRAAASLVLALGALSIGQQAHAVPSFARQTGMDCFVCHTNYPELTPFGRQFKLLGYTLTNGANQDNKNHLAAMMETAMTNTANVTSGSGGNPAHNNQLFIPQVSLFYAGKLSEHTGAFVQYTYDSSDSHRWGPDNTDFRYARQTKLGNYDLIVGASVNNSPTVSDIYNSTSIWGFPYLSDPEETTPGAATVLEGALGPGTVGGLGAYAFLNNTLYAEVNVYRPAVGRLSVFREGTPSPSDPNNPNHYLDGSAPYWRLALEHQFGNHNLMIGTHGIVANIYPDPTNPTGPSDHFRDLAVDAQYQYFNGNHVFTAQGAIINEKQTLNGTYAGGGAANLTNTLRTSRIKASYIYNHQYGATLGLFNSSGSADSIYWPAVAGGSSAVPNSSGYVAELNYFPVHKVKLALQYTGYTKFNGATDNYDGQGRNARDNNSLFLVGQFMF